MHRELCGMRITRPGDTAEGNRSNRLDFCIVGISNTSLPLFLFLQRNHKYTFTKKDYDSSLRIGERAAPKKHVWYVAVDTCDMTFEGRFPSGWTRYKTHANKHTLSYIFSFGFHFELMYTTSIFAQFETVVVGL
jgi:hypothetical protein